MLEHIRVFRNAGDSHWGLLETSYGLEWGILSFPYTGEYLIWWDLNEPLPIPNTLQQIPYGQYYPPPIVLPHTVPSGSLKTSSPKEHSHSSIVSPKTSSPKERSHSPLFFGSLIGGNIWGPIKP